MPERAAPRGRESLTIYSANLWARNAGMLGEAIARSIASDVVIGGIELGDAPAARLDTILAAYPHHRAAQRGGALGDRVASTAKRLRDAEGQGLAVLVAEAETFFGPVNLGSLSTDVALALPAPLRPDQPGAAPGRPTRRAGGRGSRRRFQQRLQRPRRPSGGDRPDPRPRTWPSVFGVAIDHVWRSPAWSSGGWARRRDRTTGR